MYEKQTVELYESKFFLSVYPTKESVFTLRVGNVHYLSEEATSQSGETLTYGPFKDLEPISFSKIEVFFTFPYPLPFFKEASRSIFVSHWGSI